MVSLVSEQQYIIDIVSKGNNVICNAVAGAGKTTTVLSMANQLKRNFLLLTYNNELCKEVRTKALQLYPNINNIEIFTYHGYANANYNKCHNDVDIKNIIDSPHYHNYIKKYLLDNKICNGDSILNSIIDNYLEADYTNTRTNGLFPYIDVIVIDEVQDMTKILFQFVMRLINDVKKMYKLPQLVLLGDDNQAVYRFKGAYKEFLTCEELWMPLYNNFIHATLSISFRLPLSVVKFVNMITINSDSAAYEECYNEYFNKMPNISREREVPFPNNNCGLNYSKGCILPFKNDETKVSFAVCSLFNNNGEIADFIPFIINKIKELKKQGAKNEDIFILAPGVSSDKYIDPKSYTNHYEFNKLNPIVRLQHALSQERENYVYVAPGDDLSLTSKELEYKIVISTFHQAKGRERDYVFVIGFDDSYFKYYGRDYCNYFCNEVLYVALTRAKKELILIAGNTNYPFKFLKECYKEEIPSYSPLYKESHIDLHITHSGYRPPKNKTNIPTPMTNTHSVTSIIKFIAFDTVIKLNNMVDELFFLSPDCSINEVKLDTVYKDNVNGYSENLLVIYGTALLTYWDYKYMRQNTENNMIIDVLYNEHDYFKSYILSLDNKTHASFLNHINNAHDKFKNNKDEIRSDKFIQSIFHFANIYYAYTTKYNPKLYQTFHNRKWIHEHDLDRIMNNITRYINYNDRNHKYEYPISHETPYYKISGKLDYIDDDYIYEFKCTKELTYEHKYQLCIYAYIWNTTHCNDKRIFRLLNIRTGELYEIAQGREHQINEFFEILLANKEKKSDVNLNVFCKRVIEYEDLLNKKLEESNLIKIY